MKFVDVNPFFYPYRGGIENRINDTAKLLVERGHDVTILTSRLPDTEEEETAPEGYRIIRLPSKTIDIYNPPMISSKGVLEALNSLDADAVNYNYRWAPSYNKDLKRYDGRKLFTYHNTWGEGTGLTHYASEVNDWLFRGTLDTFDAIVAVSNNIRDDLIRRGYSPDKVVTIPNGHYYKEPEKMPEGDFILSLGRLVKVKGLNYMVEAMKDVDCKLVVCGKGPEMDSLVRQVSKLGIEDRVIFKGYVSESEKQELMATCKLFVMPSIFEAFGIAAVEQMWHSKPLVCTNVNGLPETVGEGAITVNPRDPKALADAINRLLDDDAYRLDMGAKAKKQAESFAWPNFASLFEKTVFGL